MATAIDTIKECCENKQNFVLNGGAGSGKTYTLVETLKSLYDIDPTSKIACITFTNAAKYEINDRSDTHEIVAYTIHEFLWAQIKTFQIDLKKVILASVDDGGIKYNYNGDKENLTEELYKNIKINYKEYTKLEEGVFSHDDLLKIAERMFAQYPLLSRIIGDRFDYIFIDEYQDTSPLVIKIFLEHIQNSLNKPIIGLFGDSMQAIYGSGIGNIKDYINDNIITDIPKPDNYRCSKAVIKTINQLRLDDLQQTPAGDKSKEGTTTFLYSDQPLSSHDILCHPLFKEWHATNSEETKILYLTHKLIATEMGFPQLVKVHGPRLTDDDKLPKSIDHLLKAQIIVNLYKEKKYNQFIIETNYKISNITDKKKLKEHIDYLTSDSLTIGEFIDYAHRYGVIKKTTEFREYIEKDEDHQDKYNKVREISVKELQKYLNYRDKISIYSTQHGIKGAEFDNVLVIMDNGKWNQYNFTYLFENRMDKQSILERTQKLFYVACSRAKDNLVVYCENPSPKVLAQAERWFNEVVKL